MRGLGGENRSAVGREALKAVKGTAGVEAVLNRSVARLAVTVDAGGPTPQELRRVVAEAERSVNEGVSKARQRPLSLPGDDVLLLARTAGATAAAAGLGLAVTGSVLRLRGLSEALSSIPTLTDHVPRLRRQVEERIGSDGADLLFAVVNSTAAALTVSPVSAAYEAANRAMLAAEAWNGRMAWRKHEPELAAHAESDHETDFNRWPPDGSAERYADRAGAAGVGAAAALGLLSRNAGTAAVAAAVVDGVNHVPSARADDVAAEVARVVEAWHFGRDAEVLDQIRQRQQEDFLLATGPTDVLDALQQGRAARSTAGGAAPCPGPPAATAAIASASRARPASIAAGRAGRSTPSRRSSGWRSGIASRSTSSAAGPTPSSVPTSRATSPPSSWPRPTGPRTRPRPWPPRATEPAPTWWGRRPSRPRRARIGGRLEWCESWTTVTVARRVEFRRGRDAPPRRGRRPDGDERRGSPRDGDDRHSDQGAPANTTFATSR